MAVVYKIVSPSGKAYIGVTENFWQRWLNHRVSDSVVGRSLRKYGGGAHTVEYLAALPIEEAYAFERDAIHQHGTLAPDGLNLVEGGLGSRRPSLEVRQKMSRSQKGRKHSSETKARMSEVQKRILRKGKPVGPLSEAHKARVSFGQRERWARDKAAGTEYTASESTRLKMSESAKQRCLREGSPYHRNVLSSASAEEG